MDPTELSTPIIGLQCTMLAIFFVAVSSNIIWVVVAFILVLIGILFTIGWTIRQSGSGKN